MKGPHIRKIDNVWYCKGGEVVSTGITPKEAYQTWVADVVAIGERRIYFPYKGDGETIDLFEDKRDYQSRYSRLLTKIKNVLTGWK